MKIPKMPKGLAMRIRKEEAKQSKLSQIAEKKKDIESLKKRLEVLKSANSAKKVLPKKKG